MLNRFRSFTFILLFFTLMLTAPTKSYAQDFDNVFVQLYGGQFVNMDFMGLFTLEDAGKTKDAYMLTVGAGIENYIWKDYLGLGIEGNVGLHWGYHDPTFYEFSGGPYLRWYLFPWSKKLKTFVTLGDGLSYNTQHAQYEYDYGSSSENLEARLLNFLFFEVGVGVTDNVDIYYRAHHRCSAWGTVGFPKGAGVNFHTMGLRYNF
jgi:hypothetical protein